MSKNTGRRASWLLVLCTAIAHADDQCPVSKGEHTFPEAPFPGSHWHGSRDLAVALPEDGAEFSVTRPGANLSAKMVWWSRHYAPSPGNDLETESRSLTGSTSNVRIVMSHAVSQAPDGGPPYGMMMGIDVPEPGCWEVRGRFGAYELAFVFESR